MNDNNSFTSHFVELRSRLIKSLIFIFAVFVILSKSLQKLITLCFDSFLILTIDLLSEKNKCEKSFFISLHINFKILQNFIITKNKSEYKNCCI